MAHLGMTKAEVGVTRYGELMDYFECWLQEKGVREPFREVFIDDIMD